MSSLNKEEILNYLGVDSGSHDHKEKILSGIGVFISIACFLYVTIYLVASATAVYIIPSMGATAVLVFAAPHVPFSQPWNVFGGHLISAVMYYHAITHTSIQVRNIQ